ncbi:AsnC family transcriptional regulator [Bradyrhizobium ottawaense]|uniref:AsnC family transcriptional regulator n=1 Tax=Bradyrhizobium ottawaense TaxID=931866 RepID=UPI003D310A10
MRGVVISREIRLWPEVVMQYDRIDARILEIVQKNNRLTSDVIGEMAGLSPTACRRRLKRLRAALHGGVRGVHAALLLRKSRHQGRKSMVILDGGKGWICCFRR